MALLVYDITTLMRYMDIYIYVHHWLLIVQLTCNCTASALQCYSPHALVSFPKHTVAAAAAAAAVIAV